MQWTAASQGHHKYKLDVVEILVIVVAMWKYKLMLSNYILAQLKYMLGLLKNKLVLIKITLYFDKNKLYVSNTTLYVKNSQLSCREIQIHVFSLLSNNLFVCNFITCISTRRIAWSMVKHDSSYNGCR